MKSFAWPLAMALFAACSLPAAEFPDVTCEGSYEFDCSLGIVGLPDGRLLAADAGEALVQVDKILRARIPG